MTQASFPVMLDKERAKYVTREIAHEQTIKELNQQLIAATDQIAAAVAACKVKDNALRKARHILYRAEIVTPTILEWETRWQKENNELRQQVTLLRDACHELMILPNKYPGHREMASIAIITKVLATTEPK